MSTECDLGPRRSSDQTAAGSLAGVKLPGGWRVSAHGPIKRRDPGGSPLSGMAFSICYEAEGPKNQRAAVKALDFERHMRADDPVAEIGFWTRMFEHERDLLIATSNDRNTARRVVRLYGSGTIDCRFAGEPSAFPVPYLVMELADDDVRVILSNSAAIDVEWRLTCLHDVAASLSALHSTRGPDCP